MPKIAELLDLSFVKSQRGKIAKNIRDYAVAAQTPTETVEQVERRLAEKKVAIITEEATKKINAAIRAGVLVPAVARQKR